MFLDDQGIFRLREMVLPHTTNPYPIKRGGEIETMLAACARSRYTSPQGAVEQSSVDALLRIKPAISKTLHELELWHDPLHA